MNEFDPMQVNIYPVEQLADMIEQGICQLQDLYMCGLSAQRRIELNEILKNRKDLINEDEERWVYARQQNNVPAYRQYLSKYDNTPPQYRGKHVVEAKLAIEALEADNINLRKELFQTMKERPGLFTSVGVRILMEGLNSFNNVPVTYQNDIISRFAASGQTISYEELINEKIIPSHITKDDLLAPELNLCQTNINQLGVFPDDKRTDVYFFGVPRSGKTAVLAGILSYMNFKGIAQYIPHWNQDDKDLARDYYYGLVESTEKGRFAVSTAMDTLSFMKLDLEIEKRKNKLTFVELGGEAFRHAYETGLRGDMAWQELGAGTCLRSNNKKLLFFVLDYSITKGENNLSSESEQARILETALTILSTDGKGRDNSVGCTFSKIDTVAIILTKSDLIAEPDDNKRNKIAMDYVGGKFASFMRNLEKQCRRFGVNRPVNYKPYIIAFSIGKKLIGNLYDYNPRDSKKVVEFINDVTAGENTGFFGRLLGND